MRPILLGLFALVAASGTTHADDTAPNVPDGVSVTSLSSSAVRVTWYRPADDVGVDGYNVYRDGRYRATAYDTNYVDYGVSGGGRHEYSVVAFDAARNYTVASDAVGITVGDGERGAAPRRGGQPSAPSGLEHAAADEGTRLNWSSVDGAAGYNVYRNGDYYATVRSSDYVDSRAGGDREHRYQVVAFSDDARYSPMSDSHVARGGGGTETNSSRAVVAEESNDSGDSNDAGGSNDASDKSDAIPGGYRLVFSDEFDGGSIDGSKWNTRYRWGPNWVINNERQYYIDSRGNPDFGRSPFDNGGGKVSIKAERTSDGLRGSANSQPWTSGAMTTYGKFKMKYGYVEMRAKLPRGNGLWPAFWLLHQDENGNRPEIDVVEMLGKDPQVVYQTYHYYDNGSLRSTPSYQARDSDYSSDFHTYGMKWEPGRITWYVDGRETNRHEGGNVADEEMYLLANVAVGGSWAGEADGSTPSPARMDIDYIRAYRN